MAGGNPKGSSHKQPSSSSSSHRKSRWESGNNPPADQKPGASGDPKPSKPSSNPKENSTPPSAPTPSPGHPKTPADPIPKPLAGPGLIPPAAGAPLPDVAALGPPPPPTPTYGFHMLDRRTIVLADGSVRSYFALPPDYQDYAPPARPLDPAARFLPLGQGGHGPEPGGLGFDKRFQPGGVPFGREVFRDREDQFGRGRHQDYWNSLGLDGRGPVEGSLKRKFGDDEEERARREEKDSGKDEFARQRQQLLLHGNAGAIPNGFPPGVGGRVDLLAGTSSPYRRDLMDPGRGDELRSSKFMRMGGSFDSAGNKHYDVDPVALKKAYLHFVKMINENASQRKTYLENGNQGRPQCVVCGRSKDFPDMHGLIMHTYNYDNADMRVDHLGLHKALCVLMGWNYSKPPDNTKAYQFLSADEAAENQDDLIMWPPVVIIHNTITGKGKEGRMEGLGNKAMDNKLRGPSVRRS
ncbi:uncharacterized protein LOC131151016 isoform X2 [Malania oleifera]|uniref:uncharacterized protein LOC131151016 isoform X2 n=1 Tax=Malania oleifera TaxID=397392 RepID=UPI0025ADD2C8|nr:uncharacterized protein LOC131151016 isoform X2 [Malania oleifera]